LRHLEKERAFRANSHLAIRPSTECASSSQCQIS
jgi:hypothetical protein